MFTSYIYRRGWYSPFQAGVPVKGDGNSERRLDGQQLGRKAQPLAFAALFAAIGSACLWVSPTLAAPEGVNAQCLESYAEGQRARKRGAFSAAHEAFTFCGGASCPQALHADCLRWLDEVEAATPTSVFRVVDASGQQLQGVRVSVNGGAKQRLNGRALTLDPGKHTLVFERNGYRPLTRSFTFSEGEKLVVREVQLKRTDDAVTPAATVVARSNDSPPFPIERSTSLTPAWIGAGIGAAGFAGFAYFGLSARSDDRALDQCTPNCSEQRVEEVEQQYLWANVSLGVGAVGILGALAWVLFSPEQPGTSEQTTIADVRVYLGPTTRIVGRF